MSALQGISRELAKARFVPEDDEDRGRIIPRSWTTFRHEPVESTEGETRFYALLIKLGALKNLARSEPAILTLYVKEDGSRAFERAFIAEEGDGGRVPNPSKFASSVGRDATFGDSVEDDRKSERYRELIEDLYQDVLEGETP